VERGVIYPRYGYFKRATDFVKKKIGGLFKTKEQRKLDAMPKYPDDLRDVDTKIDTALKAKLADNTATPEQQVEVAKANERQNPSDETLKAVEAKPAEQLKQKEAENQEKMASGEPKTIDKAKEAVKDEMQENEAENASEDLKEVEDVQVDELGLEESLIRYYDPVSKRYILESINLWTTTENGLNTSRKISSGSRRTTQKS
jgi:flagellar biosynthesis GTPase FlhF